MKASIPANLQDLFTVAKRARENAYAPYSKCKVGAAVRTTAGKIFAGCNVENSSYGATTCAERVAIQSAVSDSGNMQIAELMVVTDATPPWPPCGLCRQVITEFAPTLDIPIHAANLTGELKTVRLKDIFPDAFTPSHLKPR